LAFEPGRLSKGFDPGDEPVAVSVSDARGTLWSVSVNSALFKRRGHLFVGTPKPRSNLSRHLRTIQVGMRKNGTAVVSGQSNLVTLIPDGSRALQAPLAVKVQIGDDAGVRSLPCLPGPRGVTCK
jgi:hypothetical protein